MYLLDDYDYRLPEALIAQAPAPERDRSRLLHLERGSGRIFHRRFADMVDLVGPEDLLVVNDTAVIPARLFGEKETGGKVEVLILDYAGGMRRREKTGRLQIDCLVRASRSPGIGGRILFETGAEATVIGAENGTFSLDFGPDIDLDVLLNRIGHVPLPPYIRRRRDGSAWDDRNSYQNVYARHKGAVAAPTAGLHFSDRLLEKLKKKGVAIAALTLHVGYGTFLPVKAADIRDHRMHAEGYCVSPEAAEVINIAKEKGKRIVGVGTTSVRTLEHLADENGKIRAGTGQCRLFIYPGYRFKTVDAMITNFHLPKSTLLMLVSAFAGRESILEAYREAVGTGYRFYSYGDAMLIE
jgi:S-adenosylmethionine:tRNA ribosyltransferase-isomerase